MNIKIKIEIELFIYLFIYLINFKAYPQQDINCKKYVLVKFGYMTFRWVVKFRI